MFAGGEEHQKEWKQKGGDLLEDDIPRLVPVVMDPQFDVLE